MSETEAAALTEVQQPLPVADPTDGGIADSPVSALASIKTGGDGPIASQVLDDKNTISAGSKKKRKTISGAKDSASGSTRSDSAANLVKSMPLISSRDDFHRELDFTPPSLHEIRYKLELLAKQVPEIPAALLESSMLASATPSVLEIPTAQPDDSPITKHEMAVSDGSPLGQNHGGELTGLCRLLVQSDASNPATVPVVPKHYQVCLFALSSAFCGCDCAHPPRFCFRRTPRFPWPLQRLLYAWCLEVSNLINDLYKLISWITSATYFWNRSGSSQQNVSLLVSECQNALSSFSNHISPRINDIVTPVKTLVTESSVSTTTTTTTTTSTPREDPPSTSFPTNGDSDIRKFSGAHETVVTTVVREVKENNFRSIVEDLDYLNLCYYRLHRQLPVIRRMILTQIDKLSRICADYHKAQQQNDDSQQESRHGFMY
jgi:hypothetical protein